MKKNTPFFYLDTHAGCGYYDLYSASANKTKEYNDGIKKIQQQSHPPDLIQKYLTCLGAFNQQMLGPSFDELRFYPGSPFIAQYFSRLQDRLVACELQLEQYQILKANINQYTDDKKIITHHMNGFLALKSLLPPTERRGLVLIDPPYENINEFSHILDYLLIALKRWKRGIFMIWYPLKDKKQTNQFMKSLIELNHPILFIELSILTDIPQHLYGCGVAIINPPWLLDQTFNHLLPWLWQVLSIHQQGSYRCFLKNDKLK